MTEPAKEIHTSELELYLNESSSPRRVQILKKMSKERRYIDASLCDDLLQMDSPLAERAQLLKLCDRSDPLIHEDVLSRCCFNRESNLAAKAIRQWFTDTENVLWWRFPKLIATTASQRIIYTTLDTINKTGGMLVLKPVVNDSDLNEFTDTLLSLVFYRALQWSFNSEKLVHLAESKLVESVYSSAYKSELMAQAASYLARFSPLSLKNLVVNPLKTKEWEDTLSSFRFANTSIDISLERLTEFCQSPPEDDSNFYLQLLNLWPATFMRDKIPANLITQIVVASSNRRLASALQPPPTYDLDYSFFSGLKESTILSALKSLDGTSRSWFLEKIHCYLSKKNLTKIRPLITDEASVTPRIAADLGLNDQYSTEALKNKLGLDPILDTKTTASRREYINTVFLSRKSKPLATTSPWDTMLAGYIAPKKADRNQLKSAAREVERAFAPAIFKLVERFTGCDDMLPLVLDYLHSKDSETLLSVARSLVGVGTKMAMSHFLKIISNRDISSLVRLELCSLVSAESMSDYQAELRQMVDDIRSQQYKLKALDFELIEALRELMSHQPAPTEHLITSSRGDQNSNVDDALLKKVPHFSTLNNDSKRAFRTAWIIQNTINEVAKTAKFDISPVVDLQFKGLEILFKKLFESRVYQIVQDPSQRLQRKLDALGYLRPSQEAMSTFENYLSSLPGVRDIPQFSRYKLNRVLRAIANFRSGRRFTVEGIKGYAIIFLVFARKECRYGLANTLSLTNEDDEELTNLCRDLHVYQDIRNQAVHEGLPPHMINNINGYWSLTASILERALKLAED